MPAQLRRLDPTEPLKLWDDYNTDLVEDFMRSLNQEDSEHNDIHHMEWI